jgi:manganese/iron transport system permease protein
MAALPSPLDLLQIPFLRDALIELGLLAVAGGLLGAWIVLRRLAFFSHAVGTATFPGLVAADAAHFSPRLAALAVAVGYAGGVERAGRRGRDPGDAATALGLVAALALGVVLASNVLRSGASVDRLLFGTVLAVGGGDLAVAGAAAAVALMATIALGRAWTATAFDPDGAPALGLPRTAPDLLLLLLVAAAAVAAIPAVGALLVTSLLVVPAAAARLVAPSVPRLLGLSVAFAGAEAAAGLYLSWWLDVPPGPALAVLGAVVYAAVALATRRGAA